MENRTKDELRDALFEKYFEVQDGVLASHLVDQLSFIPNTWKELHTLCERNIKFFHPMHVLKKFRMIMHQGKKYLVLQLGLWNYVIIDVEKKENLSKTDFYTLFDEDFFVEYFDEKKEDDKAIFKKHYRITEYEGNTQELINLYKEKRNIFELSMYLRLQYEIGEAWTYFSIDFANEIVHLGFQTPNHILYENLNLNYDLTPLWGLQDAQKRMELERIFEMFEKIKEIRIPKEVIPSDLYKQYVLASEKENPSFQKKKINGKAKQ